MNCKNCQEVLEEEAKFCSNCGAEVIHDRLTLKRIWKNFASDFFGWDNKYLFTWLQLVIRPEIVLKEYLNGTRKKYIQPIAYIAIGTAIAMIIFNQFADQYIELNNSINEWQMELMENQYKDKDAKEAFHERIEEDMKGAEEAQKTILKYFNLFTLLILPFYALIAFFVFGKPYNYAEHLVITCYAQGTLSLVSTVFFILSLIVNPSIYFMTLLVSIAYYLYAYGRLYELSAGKIALKLLKFFGVLLGFLVSMFVLGVIVGLIGKILF